LLEFWEPIVKNGNPYHGLSPKQFWSTAVAGKSPLSVEDIYSKKFGIPKSAGIAAAGSCFAQHVTRYLREGGYGVMDVEPSPPGLSDEIRKQYGYSTYSARYGNIYTVRQLLQLAKEAFGLWRPAEVVWEKDGRYYDALRPGVEPEGLSTPAEVEIHRAHHLAQVRRLFERMDFFIFTFGLTEAWIERETGTVFPMAPGTIAGVYDPKRYKFKNFIFGEVVKDFREFRALVHAHQQKKCKFLLTVSPVPLTATASQQHVLVATTLSKSILRTAAGQLAASFPDIDYFPSYEIITSHWSRGAFFGDNLRSVTTEGVSTVMKAFFSQHAATSAPEKAPEKAVVRPHQRRSLPQEATIQDLQCEEALLDFYAEQAPR